MKTKTLSATILLTLNFLLLTTFSFAQWEWQNPLPQGNSIKALSFIDENNGWAVGWNTILHTSDGGSSWQIQEKEIVNYFDKMLLDVCFTDALNGWVAGGMPGFILNTEDGGQTWTNIPYAGTKLPSSKTDVFFIDQQTGWILGWAASLDSVYILCTTDEGLTWDEHTICELPATYDGGIYFVNNMKGWVVWGKKIMHTVDGGTSWEVQYNEGSGKLNDIFFIDSEHGWAVGAGTVLVTTNGGTLWEPSSDTSLTGTILTSLSFSNSNTGCIGGYYNDEIKNGIIFKTNDGGVTWENQVSGSEIEPIYCLTFENESEGFAAGDGGVMLKATNGGDDWDIISSCVTKSDFKDVFFLDADNGWAGGGLDSGDVYIPSVFNTSDGGINWVEQDLPVIENSYLYKIFFTNPQHGWSFVRENYIGGEVYLISTNDGGENWELQSSGEIGKDIFFTNSLLGWRIGENGIIQKTEDGGWTWSDQLSGTDRNLTSVIFIADETGWIAGDSVILHTSNGGESWEEQSSGIYFWGNIFFIDEQHGWVVGPDLGGYGSGKTMRTMDGGQTWEEINEFGFHEVVFFNAENGWGRTTTSLGLGGGGSSPPVTNIYKTNNGGLTWQPQSMPVLIEGGFCFTDANNGWAVSDNGTILHTNNGGASGFEEQEVQSPKSVIWNYPNPFTTSTTIEYELQQLARVQITIYNHLGKQIEVIEKTQAEGLQKVVWHSGNLPNGVYYIRLQAGEQVASGKMVLMR